MKKAKNLLLISIGVIFIGMIILYSCRSYTGPVKKVDGDKLDNNLDSGSEEEDYFDTINNCIIPALTVTKNNTLIAAIGDKNNAGKILIKTSKDGGKNWTAYNGSIKNDNIATGFAHPFFINCHNGDILLGISTTNETENVVSFYRSKGDDLTWTKESTKIEMANNATSENGKPLKPTHAFATYGNGLALRHGKNTNDGTSILLFPYYYKHNNTLSGVISTMISSNNGKDWAQHGNDQGEYSSYGAKFIETEKGDILYFLNNRERQIAWFKSQNQGKTSTLISPFFQSGKGKPMYADFVRYEFNGQDIQGKNKHVLVAFSEDTTGYKVMMSTDDFNEGGKNTTVIGNGAKQVGTSSEYHDVYPAITVLKNGTICTLAAENYDIIFRSFDLAYLSNNETNTYKVKLW